MDRPRRSACVSLAATLVLVGCGPTYHDPPAIPAPLARAAVTPLPVAQNLQLDSVKLVGVEFQPEALGRPPMLLVEEKQPSSLEALRVVFRSAKDLGEKRVAGQALATALYEASRTAKDPAGERAMRDESRAVLGDVRAAAAAGAGASEVTLRMLAALDMMEGDYAAAADVFAELKARFPAGQWNQDDRAWRVLCALRLDRNDDAMASLADAVPAVAAPEVTYVLAWARWRTGDRHGAVGAMLAALRGWKAATTRDAVMRDLLVMLARGDTPLTSAISTVTGVAESQPERALLELSDAYAFAGRWQDASAVLDAAIAHAEDPEADGDLTRMRALQARYAARSLDASSAAAFAQQAVDALRACAARCDAALGDDVAHAVRDLALFFHTQYAASFDERLLGPDRALYALYATLPAREDASAMRGYGAELETTARRAHPATAMLDKASVGAVFGQHAQEVQACYEAGLVREPTLSGAVTLEVHYAGTGGYLGESSEPAAGLEGIAGVARCALRAAASWRLRGSCTVPRSRRM